MKYLSNIKLILIMICVSNVVAAQEILWERSYGGRQAEYLSDVIATPDYGFILAGSSISHDTGNKAIQSQGNYDFWISKLNENGEKVWERSYGASGNDMLQNIKITAEGGYILGGNSNSNKLENSKQDNCKGGNDYWVVKIDPLGIVEWEKTFGGTGQDELSKVIRAKDGGYLLTGSSSSFPNINNKQINKTAKAYGGLDYWIVKLDKNGLQQWQQSYGGDNDDVLKSAIATEDGGYLLGGISNSNSSFDKSANNFGEGNDFWIIKIDEIGNIEWEESIGGEGDEHLAEIIQTIDKGFLIGGSSASSSGSKKWVTNEKGSDIWLIKLDENGISQWQKTYNIGVTDILTSMISQNDSSYILSAYSPYGKKNEEGIADYVGIKINDEGEEIWRKSVGSSGEDVLCKIIETRDGGYVMAGTSNVEVEKLHRSKKKSNSLNPIDRKQQLAIAKTAENKAHEWLDNNSQELNNTINQASSKAIGTMSDKINKESVNNVDLSLRAPKANVLAPKKAMDKMGKTMEKKGPKAGLKASRDKKTNYGNSDFWIVKLKEKDKLIQEKTKIEAMPNPATTYTNIIVGYEFTKGTATVYDLSGRNLQSFKISEQTVPINLANYPTGIYLVEIVTDVARNSIKIIKSN